MARRRRPRLSRVAPLAILLASAATPAAAQQGAGGTLLLKGSAAIVPSDASGARAGSAVALVPGATPLAAIGEPRAHHGAGRVLLMRARIAPGRTLPVPRQRLTGPGKDARAGEALGTVPRAPVTGRFSLLVGAPRTRVGSRGRAGAAFLVPASLKGRKLSLGGAGLVTIVGAAAGDRLGAAVASVPDADGDGRSELQIGAPGTDLPARPGAGAAWVIMSRGLDAGETIDLRSPPRGTLEIDGPRAGARTGAALTGADDMDGNGAGEAVVGAPGASAAYVVHVGAGSGRIDLAAAGPFLTLLGAPSEEAGTAVAVPGDLNGDGVDDVAVGAPGADVSGRGSTGAVHVVAGRPGTGTVDLVSAGALIVGEDVNDRAGTSLAAAGEADPDRRPDLLVGAPGGDPLGRGSAGAAYVVFGEAIPAALDRARDVDLALLGTGGVRMTGDGRRAGAALAGGVDFGGTPGYDIVVGAPLGRPGKRPAGGVAFLQSAPAAPPIARGGDPCVTPPVSMVLDDSFGLARRDPRNLRAGALELLAAPPASAKRVVGAFEAAQRPGQILLPVRLQPPTRGRPSENTSTLVRGSALESVRRPSAPGDLNAALGFAQRLNPSSRSAIVVTGPDATVGPAPAPSLDVAVVGVDIPADSPQERALRGLAGRAGAYAGVTADDLQAQVANFDARVRCEGALKDDAKIDDRSIQDPDDVHSLATRVRSGGDFDASVTSPAGTWFVDIVLSWDVPASTDVAVETYDIEATGEGNPRPTTFAGEELARALDGETVCKDGIRLAGAKGDSYATFRLGFGGEDATIARHYRHSVSAGGGVDPEGAHATAAAVDVYPQFFAPPPNQSGEAVAKSACG